MNNSRPGAYLVVGAESSGTRLMTRLLVELGCEGSPEHVQPFDVGLPYAKAWINPIVWRRSMPHDHQWPDLKDMIFKLEEKGYYPRMVVMSRDWLPVRRSQVHGAIHHAETDAIALEHIRQAHLLIYKVLYETNIPFMTVSYESLIQYSRTTLMELLRTLNYPMEIVPRFTEAFASLRDENKKWYPS